MARSSTPGFRTIEEIVESHDCESEIRFCQTCTNHHIPKELCRMKFNTLKENTTKMCFVAYEVSSSLYAECFKCLKGSCELHEFLKNDEFNYINFIECLREVKHTY